MTPIQFNTCLKKIRLRDISGLEEIYNEYYEKMVFVALSIVRNIEDAKDIASEVLKNIFVTIHKIEHVDSPNAWIYKSVKNKAIDFVRKDSKSVKIDDCSESAFVITHDYELRIILKSEFLKLNEIEQELFLQHFLFGFKYDEISKRLGIPKGTIKQKIHRIKEKLSLLKKYL